MELAKKLQSQYIVHVYGSYFSTDEHNNLIANVILEYCTGKSLSDKITRHCFPELKHITEGV